MGEKIIYRWILFTLMVWFLLEVGYQIYLRAKYFKNGDYKWEEYAIERNSKRLHLIEDFFASQQINDFDYERNPNYGSLAVLPENIKKTINELNKDLVWGFDPLTIRQNFSIDFHRISKEKYIINIDAGPVFKDSWNGYDFSLIITNGNNPSNLYLKYQQECDKDFFVDVQTNRGYRNLPYILHYNCNSYDILILKLFR